MVIKYKNDTIRKQFDPQYEKQWRYPKLVVEKIKSAKGYIEIAESFLDIYQYPPFHTHQLKGSRKGEWSIYLGKTGYRVAMIPCDDAGKEIVSGDIIGKSRHIKIVLILEVSNHYE